MIFLDDTTSSLEVDLTSAVATNQLPFVASYVDINTSTFNMTGAAANTGTTNNTTAVTLVAAPGATTTRQIKFLSLKNSDTAAVALWVQLNENATLREIWKGTLAVGDTLFYVDGAGWNVINSSGQIKSGSGISSIGASTDNAVVRWDGTGGTAMQNSGVIVDDSNNVTGVVSATFSGNLTLSSGVVSVTSATNGIIWQISATHATFASTLIYGTITRAANAAFDLLGFAANSVEQFAVNGVGNIRTVGGLTLSGTAANIALGSNFISNGGTDAGLSLDASNNATLSGNLTVSGTTSAIGNTISSTTNLILSAGTTGVSSLRVPHGSAPTSPVDGDIWTTTAGLFVRINGATVGPLS